MLLGIDASQANRADRTGTEWYAFYLINEFKKLLANRSDIRVRLYLRGTPRADLVNNLPDNFEVKILRWPLKYLWGQGRLSLEMLFNPPDILFCPAHTIPLVCPKPSPLPHPPPQGEGKEKENKENNSSPLVGEARRGGTFTTLHDIGFEDYPELYDKLSLWYHKLSVRLAIRKATHIFTISNFSKQRIMDVFDYPEEKLTVTYLGTSPLPNPPPQGEGKAVLEKYGLREKKYLFYIGRLEPKKNILNMIKGFEMSGADLIFALAGPKVAANDVDKYLREKPGLAQKIKFLGYVAREEVFSLYHGAFALMFATLYEGFGLPILEAQVAKIPVITSNTGSSPEIAGSGAVVVHPDSPYEIGQAIRQLTSNKQLVIEKIALGIENAKKFDWQQTASETLAKILKNE